MLLAVSAEVVYLRGTPFVLVLLPSVVNTWQLQIVMKRYKKNTLSIFPLCLVSTIYTSKYTINVRACVWVYMKEFVQWNLVYLHTLVPKCFVWINEVCVLVSHKIMRQFTVCQDLSTKTCGFINKMHY